MVADGERGALIGPRGEVAWMCAPGWDSEAVFSSLIGGSGIYAVTPARRFTWGGYYEPATLIWRSRWVTSEGVVESHDALALPADPRRVVMIRRVVSCDTDQSVEIRLSPHHGFGRHGLVDLHHARRVWSGRSGDIFIRWQGPSGVRSVGQSGISRELQAEVQLEPGQHLDLVLEMSGEPLDDELPDPDRIWDATRHAWKERVPQLRETVDPAGSSLSFAVMSGLTASSGGMVAAATTSLPERAEAGRNYDYRYVWIRDQAYAGQASAAAGTDRLLIPAVRFLTARILDRGPDLAPAYRTDGSDIPDQHAVDLPGYPGGFDQVGNQVRHQFQLDAFGEALLVLSAAADMDVLDRDGCRAAEIAAEAIESRWTESDAGIWEIENRPWTHSRLACVAGLRRAATALSGLGGRAGRWSSLADRIVAEVAQSSLHASGRWQRHPDDPSVDAALLMAGIRGALPVDDPRTVATLGAVMRDLCDQGYAYRFRHDERPLSEAEGAFVLCGFFVALALHQQGEFTGAARWFERSAMCVGPPGLHAEEWDVHERQLRGNIPQAFVHALHLEAAARLADPLRSEWSVE